MNIESTCAAFHKKQRVLQFLEQIAGRPVRDWPQIPKDQLISIMNATMTNMIVETMHRRENAKKYRCVMGSTLSRSILADRCRGLTRNSASHEIFTLRDGTSLSIADYWEEKYGELQYPWLPCLDVSKGRKKNYLPMEVCEIAAGQRILKMADDQTRNMIRFTAIPPEERKNQIHRTLKEAEIDRDPAVQAFQIRIEAEMIQVTHHTHDLLSSIDDGLSLDDGENSSPAPSRVSRAGMHGYR